MTIARTRRPRLIASGLVTSVRERFSKAGELFAYELTLDQDGGAMIAVTQFVRDDFKDSDLPLVGSTLTAWVTVQESQQYGASLTFDALVSADDLDRIHSAQLVGAGK